MASSSAITTRVATGATVAGRGERSASAQLVEQLVLTHLEANDRVAHLFAPARHGIGMPLRLVVLAAGQRRLRDERSQPAVVGFVGELGELLVDDAQFVTQISESFGERPQLTLDKEPSHRWSVRVSRSGA